MATDKRPSRLVFLGGHSSRAGRLAILAFPESYPPETEFTIFYTLADDQWQHLKFDFDVASVTSLRRPSEGYAAWWLAGKRGEMVEVVAGGKSRIERIATAGTGPKNKFGYLSKIREISGELFVCGYRRQVYQRVNGSWKLISTTILDQRPKGPWNGFESIDGFSPGNLYAVGDDGEIWHYDGKLWTHLDSPTNVNLSAVRCVGREVWICGDHGVILRGDRNGWDIVWDKSDPAESWWDIEGHDGNIYVASSSAVFRLTDDQPALVVTGLPGVSTAEHLQSSDGLLWSIGANNILQFDGKAWRELVPPENR